MSVTAMKRKLQERNGIAVLCYHTLEDKLVDYPYRTRPEAMDQQLQFLKEIFRVVTAAEAFRLLDTGNVQGRDRPLAVLTFDDGFRDNLDIATALLEKHDVPAMMFPAKDHVCREGKTYLNEKELLELSRHPLWSVGAHSVSHNSMYSLLQEDLEYEVTESKRWLRELTGKTPDIFAYPQGKLSARVVAAVKPYFAYACTVSQRLGNSYDRYQIRRICLDARHDDLRSFATTLLMSPWEGETK
jgi:peptidoglycan/xylan/chitin deacetylase (PgdA/CDA1 family)